MTTMFETLRDGGRFTTLVAGLQATDLDGLLDDPNPLTLFAPSDDVLAEVPADALARLSADLPALAAFLRYHLVAGHYSAADLRGIERLTTLEGSSLWVDAAGPSARVDDALIIDPDIRVGRGLIHAIDRALLPRGDAATDRHDYSYLSVAMDR